MIEKEYILEILKETKNSLKNKDYLKIKDLSNRIVHNSSIYQDPNVVFTAVIIYSLSKLLERENYRQYANWESFYKDYTEAIDVLIETLEENNLKKFEDEIHYINELIENLSGNLKIYIADLFRKAKINKASRIYEHGISMEKTAKILGVSVWELAEYSGQTKIADVDLSITLPIKRRIKTVEEIFK